MFPTIRTNIECRINFRQEFENVLFAGCSKTARYKAPDNLYPPPAGRGVRRTVQYVATTRGEGNAVDGRFSATCWKEGHMKVVVQDNQIEKAIRDLKKKLTKEGFFSEIT